jgi:hypothetical protein
MQSIIAELDRPTNGKHSIRPSECRLITQSSTEATAKLADPLESFA